MRVIGIDNQDREREKEEIRESLRMGAVGRKAKESIREESILILGPDGRQKDSFLLRCVTPPGKTGLWGNVNDLQLTALNPGDKENTPVWPYQDPDCFVPEQEILPTPVLLDHEPEIKTTGDLVRLREAVTAGARGRVTDPCAVMVRGTDYYVVEYVIPEDKATSYRVWERFPAWVRYEFDVYKDNMKRSITDLMALSLLGCHMDSHRKDLLTEKGDLKNKCCLFADGKGLHIVCLTRYPEENRLCRLWEQITALELRWLYDRSYFKEYKVRMEQTISPDTPEEAERKCIEFSERVKEASERFREQYEKREREEEEIARKRKPAVRKGRHPFRVALLCFVLGVAFFLTLRFLG